MAEAVAERVRRYILDGGDEDLRRLLGIAEISAVERGQLPASRDEIPQPYRVARAGAG